MQNIICKKMFKIYLNENEKCKCHYLEDTIIYN